MTLLQQRLDVIVYIMLDLHGIFVWQAIVNFSFADEHAMVY